MAASGGDGLTEAAATVVTRLEAFGRENDLLCRDRVHKTLTLELGIASARPLRRPYHLRPAGDCAAIHRLTCWRRDLCRWLGMTIKR